MIVAPTPFKRIAVGSLRVAIHLPERQHIASVSAQQRVVPKRTPRDHNRVIPRPTDERVRPRSPIEQVVALAPIEQVITRAARQRVIARLAIEPIVVTIQPH